MHIFTYMYLASTIENMWVGVFDSLSCLFWTNLQQNLITKTVFTDNANLTVEI